MAKKAVKKAAAAKDLYLYYLDSRLHLDKEKASSSEVQLLLKTHPNHVVGFYTRHTSREIILDDAAFTRDLLLKKRAA